MIARLHSPWGTVDWSKEIAPGITAVTTPSHGGFLVSQERWAAFKARFPQFRTFNGNDAAFEEDCDWAACVAMWPELFTADDRHNAARTIRGSKGYFKDVGVWIDTAEGQVFFPTTVIAMEVA